VHSAD